MCYYVVVMNYIKQTYDPLANFQVYRDGKLDKSFQRKKLIKDIMQTIGRATYNGLEVLFDGIDDMNPNLKR